MLKYLITIFIATGLLSCNRNEPFNSLSEIEGSWKLTFDESSGDGILEIWEKVNDTLYSGKSFEILGNDTTITENIQIVKQGGDVFYIPTVFNQNNNTPVLFRLTKHQKNGFTFENPQHDFPSVIVYQFTGVDSLTAIISGQIKGEPKSIEFKYRRM